MNRFFLAGLIILSIILVISFLRSDFFTIKKIDVKSERVACANDNELKDSSGLLGQNFFLINAQKSAKKLTEKFICIKNVTLLRMPPNNIKLEVFGREAVAILSALKEREASESAHIEEIATPSAQEEADSFLVDSDGVIFSKDFLESNIPRIYFYDQNISLGNKLGKLLRESLKILNKIRTFGLDIKNTRVLNDLFLIYPQMSLPKIIFRMDDKIDIQLASLQLILEQSKIDNKELEFIDLRFDKPIVKFAPEKK